MGKKTFIILSVAALAFMLLSVQQCKAIDVDFGIGSPVKVMGYLQQSAAYGLRDEYDTKRGINQALFQGLVEASYTPVSDLRFYGSAKLNIDWAYPLYRNNNEWKDKGFRESDDRLYVFDDGKDLINEFHVTWWPGNFGLRLGKQIVVWGESDGFRLMDQLNPSDVRRGMGDVQFENTILPLWLAKAEYSIPTNSTWLTDIGIEFVINPNIDFRGNLPPLAGGDFSGVWGANVTADLGGPFPFDYAHIGSFIDQISEPSGSDGFEYGVRIKSVIRGALFTLNGFYGRDNDPVRRSVGIEQEISPRDGRLIFHPIMDGYYPLFRFVGATFSKDFEILSVQSLGNVAPTFRMEMFYAFDTTFQTSINTFEESDEFRWMVGADWKVKIAALNPTTYFFLSGQLYDRKIINNPSGYQLQDPTATPLCSHNYTSTLIVNTSYFHNKLEPMAFWMRDITNHADLVKFQLSWTANEKLKYTIGMLWIDGRHTAESLEVFDNKDNLYLTVRYQFN